MSALPKQRFSGDILRALGLPTERCTKAVISIEPNDVVRAELTTWVPASDLTELKRYEVSVKEVTSDSADKEAQLLALIARQEEQLAQYQRMIFELQNAIAMVKSA
jgi:hypothetical protein